MIWLIIFLYIAIGIVLISIGIHNDYLMFDIGDGLDVFIESLGVLLWPLVGLGILARYISDKLL